MLYELKLDAVDGYQLYYAGRRYTKTVTCVAKYNNTHVTVIQKDGKVVEVRRNRA